MTAVAADRVDLVPSDWHRDWCARASARAVRRNRCGAVPVTEIVNEDTPLAGLLRCSCRVERGRLLRERFGDVARIGFHLIPDGLWPQRGNDVQALTAG